MSKKTNLTNVTNTYDNTGAINTNFERLNRQFENTLSLDGSTPNALKADLDMNSNDILNVKDINVKGDLIIDGETGLRGLVEEVREKHDDVEDWASEVEDAYDDIVSIGPVSYRPQSLDPSEQDQARDNIGLGSAATEDADIFAKEADVFAPAGDVVLLVPSDYATVQEALDDNYRRFYESGMKVRIRIESGHQLTHGWTIEGGDWSQFIIESEDPVVRTVQVGFVPVDTSEIPESQRAIAFYKNCNAPVLGTVIRGWADPAYDGMICFSNTNLEVLEGCGVENTRMNFEMRQGGCLSAQRTVWNDALRGCVRLTNGVQFSIAGASMNWAWTSLDGTEGMYSSAAFRVSRGSFGQGQGVIVHNSGARCVTVARSFVNLMEADMANTGLTSGGSTNTPLQIVQGAIVTTEFATYNGSPLTANNFSPSDAPFNFPAGGTGIVFNNTGDLASIRSYLDLDVGSAAYANLVSGPADTSADKVLVTGYQGLGSRQPPSLPSLENDDDWAIGFYRSNSSMGGRAPGSNFQSIGLFSNTEVNAAAISFDSTNKEIHWKGKSGSEWDLEWLRLLSTGNTVIDANGFVKEASPVVRVFADRIEANADAEEQGVEFERVSEGAYELRGSSGFAQTGWRVEVPRDENGNRLVHVTLSEESGIITLETRTPSWQEGQLVGGDLVDIPEGRWVDIRLQEVAVEQE